MASYTNHKGLKAALRNPPTSGHCEHKDTTARGLYFRVYSTGSGVFVHRYKISGQRRVFAFDFNPLYKTTKEADLSAALTKARAIHAQQRTDLKAGIDPAIERNLKALELASMPTVEEFSRVFIERHAKKNKSQAEQARIIAVDIVPAIGGLKVDAVKRTHIISLLDRKEDTGALVARNRLLSLLSKLMAYALERGLIEVNPVRGIKKLSEQSRARVLTEQEIRNLWESTGEESNLSPSMALALRFALVTGQRMGEVLQCHRDQISGTEWIIPDTKNGTSHSVTLSPMAMTILERAKPFIKNGLFFAGQQGQVMESQAASKAMNRMKWQNPNNKVTPHDLRRTFTTGISTLGFNRLIQDKVTNHKDNSVGGIYDRNDYEKQKQLAMQAWARKLAEILNNGTSNIVPFRAA